MKTIFTIICSLCFFLTAQSQTVTGVALAQQLIDTAVTKGACVGLAAGIASNGTTTWASGSGNADRDTKAPFTPTTISRIASITKPMTAIAVMQLVEQNKIVLDEKMSVYIPAFAKAHLKEVTVRHVLQHTSGIGGYINNKDRNNYKDYPTMEAAMHKFLDRELDFTPNSTFGYSSYGYVTLGVLIEKVSGQSYEAYLKEHIWEVAGMDHTSIEDFGTVYENKAALYHQKKPGKIKTFKMTNLSDRVPGGGVQSTIEDLLKFGNALLDWKLISEASFLEMTKDHGLKKEGSGYGYGWYLYGVPEDRGSVMGHTGAQLGTSSFLMMIPSQKLVVAVISSTSGAMQEISGITTSLISVGKELSQE